MLVMAPNCAAHKTVLQNIYKRFNKYIQKLTLCGAYVRAVLVMWHDPSTTLFQTPRFSYDEPNSCATIMYLFVMFDFKAIS